MIYRTFIALSFVAVLAGCSTSPLVRYPDFPGQKKKFSSTIILADVVVLTSLIGDTSCIDMVENTKMAKQCLLLFAGKLNEKGYNADRTLFASSGLLMNKEVPYRIIKNPDQRLYDENLLEVVTPPFYLHDLFSQDTIRRQLLALTYSSIMNYQKEKEEKNKTIPAAAYLGKSLGGGMMAMVFMGGCNVGVVNQFGKYLAPSSLTEEKISVQTISQFSLMFYLVDTATGEVVWDDRIYVKGGLMHGEKLQNMIEKLCDELP